MADIILPNLELKFRPDLLLITIVRRFVSDFYDQLLSDVDTTSRVALATHELLENAVKYAADGETSIRICLDGIEGDADRLLIRTWNRATEENIAAVRRLFAEMAAERDAFAHYQKVMQRNARRTTGSGLGLSRVRAEAEMELDLEVTGLDISIIAVTSVVRRKAS